MRTITDQQIASFKYELITGEKAGATLEKYMRDVRAFYRWMRGRPIDKKDVLEYKTSLCERYAAASVNSMLSSLNSFFSFLDWHELKVKTLRVQRQLFSSQDQELTKSEYERLLDAAKKKKNDRLYLLLQTICSTGIRVSELKFITVDAIRRQSAEINCKGKHRCAFLPAELCSLLLAYAKKRQIKSGSVFVTKNGKPLDRSNIWMDMKKLCKAAHVTEKKVFPHNLRHLFARTYYSMQKDIVRLADILGHASVNTTRIYTVESGEVHRTQIQKLGLLQSSPHNVDYVIDRYTVSYIKKRKKSIGFI